MNYKNATIITGPTTVGKSEIVTKIAQKLRGELINSDRLYIYSFVKIGTGLHKYPRDIVKHLYGICKPTEVLSTEDYVKRVERIVPRILSKDKLPIIEGCSSTYNPSLIKTNSKSKRTFYYSPVIALKWRKKIDLKDRIEKRLDKMFEDGLLEEAKKNVYNKGLKSSHAIKISVVYNPLMDFFDNKLTLAQAKSDIIKRWLDVAQMQFEVFNNIPEIIWVENDLSKQDKVIKTIIEIINEHN